MQVTNDSMKNVSTVQNAAHFKCHNMCLFQLVAGSAIQAFEEVCPERIDLIHKNYRKLCNLLVDVEEWGQVVIINMLTRYSRTQFLDPNKEDVSNCRTIVILEKT